MLDYAALAALAEIIRRGSFEAAAAALGVTPSAVSQRIKGLEERMGEVAGDFQGGSVDIRTADDVARWQAALADVRAAVGSGR